VPVELVVLRLIHVLGGIVWVGSTFFSFVWLLPSIIKAGPAGGQVMVNLQKRHFMTVLPIVAILTILSGVRLMQIVSSGFSGNYFASPMGRGYAISGLIAFVAFLIGMLVARPATVRMAKLQHSAASDQTSKQMIQTEIKALQSRAAMAGTVVMVMLLLAAAGMAISRYM
jgi:uncharacterized membrane protein